MTVISKIAFGECFDQLGQFIFGTVGWDVAPFADGCFNPIEAKSAMVSANSS